MQICGNCLTLSERKISTSTSTLETEIIFNLLSLNADPGAVSSILALSHTFVECDHEIIVTVMKNNSKFFKFEKRYMPPKVH